MTTLNYIKFALDRDDRDKFNSGWEIALKQYLLCQICRTWVAGVIEIYSSYIQEQKLFQTGL